RAGGRAARAGRRTRGGCGARRTVAGGGWAWVGSIAPALRWAGRPLGGVALRGAHSITEGKEGVAVRGARRRPQSCAPLGCDRACFATAFGDAQGVGSLDGHSAGQGSPPPSAARRRCCETRAKCAGTPRPAARPGAACSERALTPTAPARGV